MLHNTAFYLSIHCNPIYLFKNNTRRPLILPDTEKYNINTAQRITKINTKMTKKQYKANTVQCE